MAAIGEGDYAIVEFEGDVDVDTGFFVILGGAGDQSLALAKRIN